MFVSDYMVRKNRIGKLHKKLFYTKTLSFTSTVRWVGDQRFEPK